MFLTNNGTPEGDKLNKALGIRKLDKKFLAIDKLSTFVKLSEQEANELKELFADYGLESLFEIRKEAIDIEATSLKKYNEEPEEQEYSEKIKNYLTVKGEEDNELEENDNIIPPN